MRSREYDAREVANFVLDHCEAVGRIVTNLSLQKIVYFCHVWSLIEFDRPLVKQNFEAWEHGPVLQYLYREFRNFGAEPITDRAKKLDQMTGEQKKATGEFDSETRELMTRIVEFYSRLSASQLRELSHAPGGPWGRVWDHKEAIRPGMTIDNKDIVEFYSRAARPFSIQ